jgi:hypothetical protein
MCVTTIKKTRAWEVRKITRTCGSEFGRDRNAAATSDIRRFAVIA